MTSPTVSQLLEIVGPESSVDQRIEALERYTEEVAGAEHRERALELLQAIKESPRRGRRNGS